MLIQCNKNVPKKNAIKARISLRQIELLFAYLYRHIFHYKFYKIVIDFFY